ncbi:CopG family transcriptional regulator [Candidatus Saccharibacteria bacterium]|nr:MAG: CopG family transcriptional regulator [Candidatus Saccharibacteria bacterium]
MSTASDKTTIYLDPVVKKFLQHKAIEEDTSISDLINERIEEEMAGEKFRKLIDQAKKEPTLSFEEALKECGLTYADLRD